MLGSHPTWTILFIASFIILVSNLDKIFPHKPWDIKAKIKTATKIHSMKARLSLRVIKQIITMALQGRSINVWYLFISAYATEHGPARVRLDAEKIRDEFERYYSQCSGEYIAPPWLVKFAENTIDPPSLREKTQQQKKDEINQEEIWQRYKDGIKTDNEHRDLAIKLLEE